MLVYGRFSEQQQMLCMCVYKQGNVPDATCAAGGC